MTVTLAPISSKAKNRLANMMDNDPVVLVEQQVGTLIFCVSRNRTWCSWVSTEKDLNWKVCDT